ncbi:hypothetical protein ISCGN_009321 [Ixodes scapularis]
MDDQVMNEKNRAFAFLQHRPLNGFSRAFEKQNIYFETVWTSSRGKAAPMLTLSVVEFEVITVTEIVVQQKLPSGVGVRSPLSTASSTCSTAHQNADFVGRRAIADERCSCSCLQPGHVVDKQEIHPNPKKVDAILEAKTPKDQKELGKFRGLLNYYEKFINNTSDILHPLHELLRKDKRWEWSRSCHSVFNEAKKQLTKSLLVHYDPAFPVGLYCDASSHGIGAVLQHVLPNKRRRAIAFMSRTFSKVERNYSEIDKEALSIVEDIKKFHQDLFGRHFTLWADHKPRV